VTATMQPFPIMGFRAIVRDGSHPWGNVTIYGRVPGAHYSTVLFKGAVTDLYDRGIERVAPFPSDPITIHARATGGIHGLTIYAVDTVGGSFQIPIRSA
jgi:hypothetical protein